ncbi:PepSY domain-containing protein [Paenibacillus eucommiae]|uniref:Membrane protein YkoI n=1 Tax=Paenibacillus eucommiae TaxID=1355755 RepID=A0ABS4J962_9BACL|nr:PepSY domain-containing protein [Paenibacillus eucommiae]MBP1996381.1 putative membrane protein YkoI [Paenibacillus eucommiae]
MFLRSVCLLALILMLVSVSGCKESKPTQSGVSALSKEDALQIAKQHVQDREAEWSARFAESEELEINNVKQQYAVWIVEAVFPGGNKETYRIDADSGKLLILTETEAPSQEK